jgi:hypothetical protein
MANHGSEMNSGGTDHRNTYEGFMTATKWGVGLVSVTLILMAIFLA